MIVRLALFPRNNAVSEAQLTSSPGLTRQDRIKVPRSATRKAFRCARRLKLWLRFWKLQAAIHRQPTPSQKRRRRRPDAQLNCSAPWFIFFCRSPTGSSAPATQLSAPALHLPTPRAVGRVEWPATGKRSPSFPSQP